MTVKVAKVPTPREAAINVKRVLLVVISLCASIAHSASGSDMEDVLVTGTLAPQLELTSSVSVLDSSEIQLLNKTTVADLLRTVPGLLVEQQGGPGGLTAVSIRGGESNFTLVLIDGVAVNDPTNFRGGSFDFANLNPAMVDRIEVVRGAQSAIYGSDALAGVINIITKRAQQGHHQQVRAEAGQDDYSDIGASALGSAGNFNYTAEVASRDDGEPTPGSTRDTDSANVRLGWQATPKQDLSVGYRYIKGDRSSYPEQGGGERYAVYDALDKSHFTQDILSFGWSAQVNSLWRSTVTASRFEQQEDYNSPGIFPYFEVPPNAADTDFTRDQYRWINTVQLAPGYEANLGMDYRHDDGSSDGYLEFFGERSPTDFELDRDSRGVFADVSATPLEDLLLHGSLRYDDPDHFDSETSTQVGAKYSISESVTLAANWGEAYKLPSFFALGHALVGNPDLEPEKGESWDLGVSWATTDTLRLSATAFNNDFRDLVDFDNETFRNVNRKEVQTSGLELQADWQVLAALSLRSQATYTDIDVKNENTVLTGRPQWTAGVVAQWQLSPQWNTSLDYQYSGQQWAASRHTGEQVTEELDDYHRVAWVLHWQLAPAWLLSLSVDNVLDEDYETAVGFAAPSREFRFGVVFSH